MAVVIKANIDVLYSKVSSLSESVKVIDKEIKAMLELQKALASKYWAGDAAQYHYMEYTEAVRDYGPMLFSMMKKCQALYKIAETYDKVEGYNLHAEAGKLPTDFLD
ncbi:hypothetical protein [Butyrivibrio sp. JL13D10]|uniref:hypothetical protein n=1 Tax=Butyrivibrio sp. JL13D10 TaxID=3236815 RepID=UPI0038B425C4